MTTLPISKAIRKAGSQRALAQLIGLKPTNYSLVSQWATGRKPVAAHHCIAIEAAAGVSRHVLRPDVFGSIPK